MNYLFIAAGTILFISLLVHMIAGDKEYRKLNPQKWNNEAGKTFGYWLMGRGTFQMVSVDLLLSSVFLFLMGFGIVPFNIWLSLFIALLYLGYLVFWLVTLFVSKARPENYLSQGQWILFLVVFILVILGIYHSL